MAIAIGDEAPDFELPDQHGTPVKLSSFRGTKNVVLVFYPLAFSGVCSSELCALREDFPEINRNDANSPSRLADHDPVVAYFVPRRVADLRITQVDVTHAPGEPTHVRAHLVNAGPEQAGAADCGERLGMQALAAPDQRGEQDDLLPLAERQD